MKVLSQLSTHLFRLSKHSNTRYISTCKLALTRELPDTFADAISEYAANDATALSMSIARSQHDAYVQILERYVDKVIRLPMLNDFPDSVFVEDTMVAVGSNVVLTNPGHPSRVGEVAQMHSDLEIFLPRMNIVDDMRNYAGAVCDGGDVMQMGDIMFVGMSHRTNEGGFNVLKDAYPGMNVVKVPPVVQGKSVLHLKSATTNLNESAILVPEGKVGDMVVEALNGHGSTLDVYRLDDALWCNVLSINGTVIAQKTMNNRSKSALEQACIAHNLNLDYVDTSELAAKDAALTCCSVLLEMDHRQSR